MTTKNAAPLLQWHIGSPVNSIAVSHDSSRIASGSDDGLVHIWDVQTGALVLGPLEGHTSWVLSVAWSHDDTRMISGSKDDTIRIWDARTGAPIGDSLRGHADTVFSVAFSPDSTRIISGSADKTIRVWDAGTGARIGEPIRGHEEWVSSVVFSPNSTCFVSGSGDRAIRIWDARTGAPIGKPLRGHNTTVRSALFSPNSTQIVSGSLDNTIRVWDARTGASIGEPLTGHENWVLSVAFSSDSAYIVSGSRDKTIRVWDARTGASIGKPLRRHRDIVWSVVFSPDSTRIVSGSEDGTICVWEIPPATSSTGTATSKIGAPLIGIVADETSTSLSGLLSNTISIIPAFEMVTSRMSIQEMFECLVKHGCSDLTSFMDTSRSSAVITSGGFGDVRRLVMDNGTVVAIKTLRLHILLKDDDKAVKRAIREVYMWSRLQHVNIQELLGIVIFEGGLGMVSPWMEHGNLKQYIAANPSVERYPLCVEVGSGVSYLHSIGMVHGDLKMVNILVSDKGILKICDFDHAILLETSLQFSATTRPGGGTLRWMAPELLQPEEDDDEEPPQVPAIRREETDIYALGMTLLEILTGNLPYAEYKSDMGIYRAIHAQKPPKRPKEMYVPEEMANRVWELLLRCWDHDPSARPDAASVLAELNWLTV